MPNNNNNNKQLKDVFTSFCSFGSGRNLATGSNEALSNTTMDNAKFSKFCKDCKIIDGKNITTTQVDILFSKMTGAGSRKVDFKGFQEIFRELAVMKYPNANAGDAYNKLLQHVSDKSPIARNVTMPQTEGVYDHLLDPSTYTGMHKERFNEDGTGRGLEGRYQPTSTFTQQEVTNREFNSHIPSNTQNAHTGGGGGQGAATKRGRTAETRSTEQLDAKSKRANQKSSNQNLNQTSAQSNKAGQERSNQSSMQTRSSKNQSAKGSNASLSGKKNQQQNTNQQGNYTSKNEGGSVFDRLTDVKGYTGTHKERFNEDGSGRGLEGRHQVTGTLSQEQVTNRSSNSGIRSST
jgi:hypothetical protein